MSFRMRVFFACVEYALRGFSLYSQAFYLNSFGNHFIVLFIVTALFSFELRKLSVLAYAALEGIYHRSSRGKHAK